MVKKVPMRLCTGCGERKQKNELIRVVRTPENEIRLDFTGKLNGRGAYICKNRDCLALAVKKKRFENAFGIAVPDDVYSKLDKELTSVE